MDENTVYLLIGLGLVIFFILVIVFNKKTKFKITTDGIDVDATNHEEKNQLKISKIKNDSKIDVKNKQSTNYEIDDVDSSTINID